MSITLVLGLDGDGSIGFGDFFNFALDFAKPLVVSAAGPLDDIPGPPLQTGYTISGRVTQVVGGPGGPGPQPVPVGPTSGPVIPPAKVSLIGSGLNTTVLTDSTGYFSFQVPNGSYTISLPGSGKEHPPVTPNQRTVTVSGVNVTGLDFTFALPPPPGSGSTPTLYRISGWLADGNNAGLPNLKVILSGLGSDFVTTTTDASGNYSFTVPNGSYKIAPADPGSSPVSRAVTVSDGNVVEQDFVVKLTSPGLPPGARPQQTFRLYGVVTDPFGKGLSGVTVIFKGGSANLSITNTTDSSGSYKFGV